MNKQDYEKQKRECLLGFCTEHDYYITPDVEDIFGYAFDRAYALGKEKETITQEEIEKAAEEYVRNNPFTHPYTVIATRESYKDGICFALGKQEKDSDTVIQGWVARSNDGPNDLGLEVYTVKPDRKKNRNGWNGHGELSYLIDCRLFPDLTWESDPEQVEIIIKRKKNG